MGSKSHRLNADQLALLKWMIGACLGLVSVSTLFNLDGYSIVSAVIACVVIGLSLLWPSGFAKLPPVVWKVYAIGIIPLVMIDVMARETVPALLNLNTWLIIYRALNQDNRREEMQLVLLCLFLQVMTGILTASLLFGIQLLVFSALAISFLVIGVMLETKVEGDYSLLKKRRQWTGEVILGTLRSAFVGRNLFLAIGMFSALMGFAALLFKVIPRIDVENKVSLFELESNKSLSGFSENVSLGEVTNIQKDNSVALRVDISENSFVPVVPYWRMLALDSYDAGSFVLSDSFRSRLKPIVASPFNAVRYWPESSFSQVPSNENRSRWTFYLEPGLSKFFPIPGEFSQMTFPELNKLQMQREMNYLSLGGASSKMVSYQLEGIGETRTLMGTRVGSRIEDVLERGPRSDEMEYPFTLLELPRDEVAQGIFRRMSEGIIDGRELDPREFARAACLYLSNVHSYSMSSVLPPSTGTDDPVARWIGSDTAGHCELFASSLVMLARAAGIPARIVVGYKGGEWNSYERYFMVRNADAHAWCELYEGDGVWFRVDPTPGSEIVGTTPRMVHTELLVGESGSNAYIDSLRMLWYRRIVNYDQQSQREAVVQLKDFFLAYMQVAEKWAGNTISYLYEWVTAPWGIWRILYFVTLGIILVVAIAIQRNLALNYREMILSLVRRGDPIRRKAGRILSKVEVVDQRAWGAEEMDVLNDLRRLRFGAKEGRPNARLVFKASRRLRS